MRWLHVVLAMVLAVSVAGAQPVPAGPDLKIDAAPRSTGMYAAPGVGLAATQIGEAVQLFVIDTAEEGAPSDFRVFINPEILEREGDITSNEGRLSFPGVNEEIERAAKVRVLAQHREGKL